MPNHGGDQGGRPTLLTADHIAPICEAIKQGCYAKVAAGRVGIDGYTLTTWDLRGQRETEDRAERALRGDPADEPASLYEQLHRALDQAKSEARYSAETRVFRAMPYNWLRSGYARNDWRESDQFVRAVEDAVEAKVRALFSPAEDASGNPPLSGPALAGVLSDLLRIQLVNNPALRQELFADLQAELHPPVAAKEQSNGHQPAVPPV